MPSPPFDHAWIVSTRLVDYVIAAMAIVLALGLRYVMNPLLGQQGPYIVLTFAVVVAALFGGLGPAVLATFLGASLGSYAFLSQGSGWAELVRPQNAWRTGLFVCMGIGIGVVGERLRAAQRVLARMVQLLQASNLAKDKAMAVLGHEIRNPLSALHTAQAVLQRASDDPARVRWASDIIQRQVEHMTRMADDLVDLSGIMRGTLHMHQMRLELRSVVEQALEQSTALIIKKGHRLETDLGMEPMAVVGDNMRLVQVFVNLLNNAAKYTDPGGTLFVHIEQASDNQALVTVADNGTGMQPESISGLFEPFARAPGAASNAEGGLGLGLSVVNRIVEAHGGVVEATSEGLGLGSRFTVRLPLA